MAAIKVRTIHDLSAVWESGRNPSSFSAGNVCVSAPVMRGIFARKRENAQQNAKTRKPRKEVQERESWTAMIISGSSGTSMQNNYIALH